MTNVQGKEVGRYSEDRPTISNQHTKGISSCSESNQAQVPPHAETKFTNLRGSYCSAPRCRWVRNRKGPVIEQLLLNGIILGYTLSCLTDNVH